MQNILSGVRNDLEILREHTFFKQLLHIAIPISIQNLIQSFLHILDQLMIGQLGKVPIAAVGLALKPFFILTFTILALTGGASIFLAQFWGKKDIESIPGILGLTLLSGLVITSVFFVLSFFYAEPMMTIFSSDKEVIVLGAMYQQYIAFTYFPFIIISVYTAVLRSTGHPKLPVGIGIFAIALNVVLNYLLIFGKFGFPQLGVKGAAISTIIAKCAELVLLIGITYIRKLPGAYSIQKIFTINFSKDFVKKAGKITFFYILFNLVFIVADSLYWAIYGHISTDAVAAVNVVFPLQGCIISFFGGLSAATSIMLGHKLGEDNHDTAVVFSRAFIILSVFCTMLVSLGTFFFLDGYIDLFKISDIIKSYSKIILTIILCILWIKVSNMVIAAGILNSGGETKFVLYTNVLSLWIISLPIGFIAAFILHLPVYWVFLLISLEELVRFTLCFRRVLSGKWLNNLIHQT